MKIPESPLQIQIKKINLTDYCGVEDIEAISEDGLSILLEHCNSMGQKGWSFVECGWDENSPGIMHLLYQKKED